MLNYYPYNCDCVITSGSNIIVKHTDNTAIVGLISNNDESVYQYELNHLVSWYKGNNLQLNVCKTKEPVVDNTRKQQKSFHPLSIKCAHVERVDNFRNSVFTFLRPCHGPSTLVKIAHQSLYYLRQLQTPDCSETLAAWRSVWMRAWPPGWGAAPDSTILPLGW